MVCPLIKVVTATSFHHADATAQLTDNLLLHANAATTLKTEASIGCDEFDDYHFANGHTNDESETPEGVDKEVVLVFGVRETKVSYNIILNLTPPSKLGYHEFVSKEIHLERLFHSFQYMHLFCFTLKRPCYNSVHNPTLMKNCVSSFPSTGVVDQSFMKQKGIHSLPNWCWQL